jgi:hypothetical protein
LCGFISLIRVLISGKLALTQRVWRAGNSDRFEKR